MLAAVLAVGLVSCAGTPSTKHEQVYIPPSTAPSPAPADVQQPAAPVAPPVVEKPVAVPIAEPPTNPKPSTVAVAKKSIPPTKPTIAISDKKPLAAVAPVDSTFKGHVDLVVGPDQTVGAGEVADAVVYFVPSTAGAKPKPGQFQIYTRDKQFDPSSLVVPVGSTISFPNQDEILHNVFSASAGGEFDLGVYGEGASASHTFNKAGLFLINCNVHQAMQSSVLVVDTPFYTHPSKSGDFVIQGIPAGDGKFVIWHPRAASVERTMNMPTKDATWTITITRPRVAGHLNKEHKKYKLDVAQQ